MKDHHRCGVGMSSGHRWPWASRGMLAVLLVFSTPLLAEMVHMKNGTALEGKILAQTRSHIQLQTPTGTLLVAKADIARIQYGPGPQQLKAEEERRQREAKAEEERRQREAQTKKLEEEKRQEEERRLREREHERRMEEQRRQREADERARHREDELLRRREAYASLSLGGGSRKMLSEVLWGEMLRRNSSFGRIASRTPWSPADRGLNLDGGIVRDAWRFEGGVVYRAMRAESSTSTLQNDAWNQLGSKGTSLPMLSLDAASGTGSVAEVRASVERELLRTERRGLGLRLGVEGARESIETSENHVAFRDSGGLALNEVRFPYTVHMETITRVGRLDARWHWYAWQGGEVALALGWMQGATRQGVTANPVQRNGDGSTTLEAWDVGHRAAVRGPVFQADLSRPLADRWRWVVSLQARQLKVVPTGLEGQVIQLSLLNGPGFLPLAILNGLPPLLPSVPLKATLVDLSLGIRRDF